MTCPGFVMGLLKKAHSNLQKNNDAAYRSAIKELMRMLTKLDTKVKFYIAQVVERAKIKKGSKLHEHGLSMQRVSTILGISLWELMPYLGKTTLTEEGLTQKGLKGRLQLARRLLS
jgi:hypothetical protein